MPDKDALRKPASMQAPKPQIFGRAVIPANYTSPDVEDRRSDWGVESIEDYQSRQPQRSQAVRRQTRKSARR
jgi:hypothetical protein